MRSVGMYEARSKFAELVDQASRGATIVVTRNGVPVAEIRPPSSRAHRDKIVDEILALDWTLGEPIVDAIRQAREERE